MNASRSFRHLPRAVVLALALAVGAAAQAGPGPGGHHGPGPGFGPGGHIEGVIAQVRAQLNLNSSQQVAFDNALAAGKAARDAARTDRDALHAAMRNELANAAPNLRTIAGLADQTQAKHQAARKQVREQWLALYETFSPEQKLVVRDMLARRAERMEGVRDRMRGRAGG